MKLFLIVSFCLLLTALVLIKTFTVRVMRATDDETQSKVLGWRSY